MDFKSILLAQKTGYIPRNHFDALFARRIGGAVLKDFPDLPSSIVTVTDAKAMPLNSLKVAIEPVQEGSGDQSPDNIRPISGWTGCNVCRTGKNIWKYGDISGKRVVAINYPDIPIGNYTISTEITSTDTDRDISTIYIVFDNRTSTTLRLGRNQRVSEQLIINNKVKEIDFYASRNYSESEGDDFTFSNIQLESGDTATAYEPYTGQDYSITFPTETGTVYGGTLDVVNGTLTVTHKHTAFSGNESYSNFTNVIVCNRYEQTGRYTTIGIICSHCISGGVTFSSDNRNYFAFKKATFGVSNADELKALFQGWYSDGKRVQVVYELATPKTYQLTPTEVQMLLGTNNIWADTGDILEGKYYGKRSSATRAMLNTLRGAGEITEITPEEPEELEEPEENADER